MSAAASRHLPPPSSRCSCLSSLPYPSRGNVGSARLLPPMVPSFRGVVDPIQRRNTHGRTVCCVRSGCGGGGWPVKQAGRAVSGAERSVVGRVLRHRWVLIFGAVGVAGVMCLSDDVASGTFTQTEVSIRCTALPVRASRMARNAPSFL